MLPPASIALDALANTFGDDALPETFPRDPYEMTREQIMAAILEHAYCFDPRGGHAAPARTA